VKLELTAVITGLAFEQTAAAPSLCHLGSGPVGNDPVLDRGMTADCT